jgi:hypothetical protein
MNTPPNDHQAFYLAPNGFTVTFDNGITASVRWGMGNYCRREDKSDFNRAMTAECAALDSFGEFVRVPGMTYDNDDVLPNRTPRQVLEFLNAVQRMPGFITQHFMNQIKKD